MSTLVEQMVDYYHKTIINTSSQSMFDRIKNKFPNATNDDFQAFITAVSKTNKTVLAGTTKIKMPHNKAAMLAKYNAFLLTNSKGKGKVFFS